jgi:hypothetical protein
MVGGATTQPVTTLTRLVAARINWFVTHQLGCHKAACFVTHKLVCHKAASARSALVCISNSCSCCAPPSRPSAPSSPSSPSSVESGFSVACETAFIRTTIEPYTSGAKSCRRRTMRWNSLRPSGYASLALTRHWTIFLLLVHQWFYHLPKLLFGV